MVLTARPKPMKHHKRTGSATGHSPAFDYCEAKLT